MFKINLFIDNAWEFDKSVKLNPNFDVKTNIRSYDSSECYETSEQAYNAIAEKIERLLIRVGFDFSKIGALRVCVFDVNEKNIESVNFKLVDNGQVGVFANWAKFPNITAQMWGVWSKLNNLLLDRKVA